MWFPDVSPIDWIAGFQDIQKMHYFLFSPMNGCAIAVYKIQIMKISELIWWVHAVFLCCYSSSRFPRTGRRRGPESWDHTVALLLTGHLQGKAEWQWGVSILCSSWKRRKTNIFVKCTEAGPSMTAFFWNATRDVSANVSWALRQSKSKSSKTGFQTSEKTKIKCSPSVTNSPIESFPCGLCWALLSVMPNSRALK